MSSHKANVTYGRSRKVTKVTSNIYIDASRQKVWEVLADLGSVSVWSPAIANSYYTSEATEGVGASRHCDFSDGGYVKEQVSEWRPGEALRMQIYEGTVPFDNFYGTFTLRDDDQGMTVSFTLEFDVRPGAPVDPAEAERQNREELIPAFLAGLKHYAETGRPMST